MVEDNNLKLGDLLEKNIIKKSIKDNELVTFIPMESVSEEGRLLGQYVMRQSEVKKGLTYFEKNDVIVAKITPCFENGKGACLDELNTNIGYGSTEFHVLRARRDAVPRYIYYHTHSNNFRKKLEREMVGSAGQKRVPLNLIFQYPLKVSHSLDEQYKISEVLSDIDNLIVSIEKLICKKQKIKRGVMQELLTGKKRLEGFKREWSLTKLGEIGKCIRGVSYDPANDLKEYDAENTVRLLRSNNIFESKINFDEVQYVNENRVKEVQYILDNDIMICMANGSKELVGKSGIYTKKDNFKYTFGAFMGVYRITDNRINQKYISYLLQTYQFRNYINILLAGSSINNLKPSDIESIEFKLPEINEMNKITEIIADIDMEIDALSNKLKKYNIIKQGMMQELLTGRIRLV